MEDWLDIRRDEKHIAREREKARELRRSSWWKNELAKGICHYCGGHFPPDELTMDHIVPVVRGGRSTRGNVVVCCKEFRWHGLRINQVVEIVFGPDQYSGIIFLEESGKETVAAG